MPQTNEFLQNLKRQWGSDQEKERRDFICFLLKIFDNDWFELLDERLRELFVEQNYRKIRQRADTSINLLRWMCDELGSIYARPAQRTVDGHELEDVTKGALDDALDEAARLNFATREIFVRPMVVDDGDSPYMVLDVVTPDKCMVIPHPKDLTRMSVFIVEKANGGFSIWTDSQHVVVDRNWNMVPSFDDDGNPDVEMANPYGMIPYIACHAKYPTRNFWHHKESTGIIEATMGTGISKTDHNHLRHFQSHRQLVIVSDELTKDQKRLLSDPTSAMHLRGAGASAQVLSLEANLSMNFETLMAAAQQVLALYGINPQAVRGTLDAQSGYALELKTHKQEQVWDSYRRSWSRCEKMIYEVSRAVWAEDGNGTLPEGELEIKYAEIGPGRDPSEILGLAVEKLNAGLISKNQARRDLGMDEEQIELMEIEILEERASSIPTPLAPFSPFEDEEEGEEDGNS